MSLQRFRSLSRILPVFVAAIVGGSGALAQDVDFDSVIGIGGTLQEQASGLARDGEGNVLISGYFEGTTDFDPGAANFDLTSAGIYDAFVAKYDPTGALLWAHGFGSTSVDYAFGVRTDSADNIYLTGTFLGTVDFDPGAGTASVTAVSAFSEAYVLKLDPDGNFVWVKIISGPRSEMGFAIEIDNNDDILTFGNFSDTPDFDPNGGTFNLTAATPNELYIQKLDSDGNFLWAVGIPGRIRDFGRFIALDDSGNVYATASFTGTADLDPGAGTASFTSAGANDAFLLKLDSTGAYQWAHAFGGAGEDDGSSVALDAVGNVFAAGTYQGTVDFDPSGGVLNLDSFSARSIYVTKFDGAGAVAWAGGFTGMDNGFAFGMTVDSSGGPIVVGSFEGTGDFDPATATAASATSAGVEDFYMTKLDGAGNWKWTEQRGTAGREVGATIITDGAGSLFTTGLYANMLDFDTSGAATTLTAVGGTDSFLMMQVPRAGGAITSAPAPGDIFENQPLTLSAPSGFSNYVWKRDGLVIDDDGPRVTGTRTQDLVFSPVAASDQAVYTVTYDDGTGTILESTSYTLVTAPAPASVPAAGLVGLGALAVLLAVAGYRASARQ